MYYYMVLYVLICMYADSLLKSRAKCWRQIGRVWYGMMYLLFPAKDVWLTSASLRALSCWMEASSHASSWTQDKREIMSNSCITCELQTGRSTLIIMYTGHIACDHSSA